MSERNLVNSKWVEIETQAFQVPLATDVLKKFKDQMALKKYVDIVFEDQYSTVISLSKEKFEELLERYKDEEGVKKYYKVKFKLQ